MKNQGIINECESKGKGKEYSKTSMKRMNLPCGGRRAVNLYCSAQRFSAKMISRGD